MDLAEMLAAIDNGSLLPPVMFADIDLDGVLDARDGDPEFEQVLSELSMTIEARWTEVLPPECVRHDVDAICEHAFLAVSRATGQHEVASYVSDDFELMALGAALHFSHPTLDRLWTAYRANQIPSPEAPPSGV